MHLCEMTEQSNKISGVLFSKNKAKTQVRMNASYCIPIFRISRMKIIKHRC